MFRDNDVDWPLVLGVVGILIALPGFVLLFVHGNNQTAGAFTMLLAVVLLVGGFMYSHALGVQPFTMIEVKARLVIHDRTGSRAQLSKDYRLRPNYRHIKTLALGKNAGDGTLSNFCWNNVPVGPPSSVTRVLGEYLVTINFFRTLPRGKVFSSTLSYDFADSFPASDEAYLYTVEFPTKRLSITIELPTDRVALKSFAVRTRGAGDVPINSLQVSADRRVLTLELTRLNVGDTYGVYWSW